MRKFTSTLAVLFVVAILVATSSTVMAQRGQGGPGRGLGPGKGVGGGVPGSPGCIYAGPGVGFQGQGRFCPRYGDFVRPQAQNRYAPGRGMTYGKGRGYKYRHFR